MSFRTTNPYIQFCFRLRILETSKLFQKFWIFTVISKPYILHFRTKSSVQIIISRIPGSKIRAISLVSPIRRSLRMDYMVNYTDLTLEMAYKSTRKNALGISYFHLSEKFDMWPRKVAIRGFNSFVVYICGFFELKDIFYIK